MGSTKTENESNTLSGSVIKKEGVFASNSKYVVCFKKLFAGKGGLYEFIMFYDMCAG